ncbi:Pkinase-domain-containing protein [Obba rivulosa]|uniref:Pkinase-domain-containing protein n=1 Tax=Obba rivulosa TaxID=1052685 RepID=A0A8E2AQH6_9APHY|nr:Pkinase-domain-containing protein [Obba rivulosa]
MSRTPLTQSIAHTENLPRSFSFTFSCKTGGTSQATDSTQPASQSQPGQDTPEEVKKTLWGYLDPRGVSPHRINLPKEKTTYTIGRASHNDCVIGGKKTSSRQCKIHLEMHGENAVVTITDLSRNGTFINKERIGLPGTTKVLRDGNEVAFGDPRAHPGNGDVEDFRYIFRCLVTEAPKGKFHEEYELVHELGRGSFGQVYLAVYSATNMRFAVKVVPRAQMEVPRGSQNAKALAREISILRRLRHKHICSFQEVVYEEKTINIVMEYVAGGNLANHIARHGHLDEAEAQRLTYQICDALAYIHHKGIAHRDLKPANILLTRDAPPQIRVADFGLAKAVSSVTYLATLCGTPGYMAPEVEIQHHSRGAYDHAVDSWSLGVIVFEMLVGRIVLLEEPSAYAAEPVVGGGALAWASLTACGASVEAERFIRALLDPLPPRRLTAPAARAHPWLAAHAAVTPSRGSSLSSVTTADPESASEAPASTAEGKRLPPPCETPRPSKRARLVSTSMPAPARMPPWSVQRGRRAETARVRGVRR